MSGKVKSVSPTFSPSRSLFISVYTRSCATWASRPRASCAARAVSFSAEKPSTEQKRTSRKMRSASSSNRRFGSPTQRRTPAFRSSCPPQGSTSVPSGDKAMALTVKSRRARSSSMLVPNVTESGWRLSLYAPSRRIVVSSMGSPPLTTVTVPCCKPVGCAHSPKRRSTSCGRASDVMS